MKKVKWSRYRPGVAQRVGRGIALLLHDHGTRRGWVVSSTPRPHFTPGKDPVPILQEAGWAPGPVWTGRKSRPTGIRSRTVQPVIGRYTDWATRPTCTYYTGQKCFFFFVNAWTFQVHGLSKRNGQRITLTAVSYVLCQPRRAPEFSRVFSIQFAYVIGAIVLQPSDNTWKYCQLGFYWTDQKP